jgi:RHS repeat-associated protein
MLASGQQSVDYAYDAAGRLTDERNAMNAQAPQDDVHLVYDNADHRTRLQLRNGVNVDYAYDAAGQLSSITYTTATTTIGGLLYDRDAVGRIIREGGPLAKVDLPAAVTGRTYNANNQLTIAGYIYDGNGRLTSNGTNNYAWDARNQLQQMSGGVTGQFSYDALGRRIRKSIGGAAKQFLYDGPNIIQELNDGSTPAVSSTILTDLSTDEAFGRTKGTTKTEYLSDYLGSTIALSDASGSSSTTYTYEPYGKVTPTGLADDNTRAFAGREDDGSGLFYYDARYFDPSAGRFLSENGLGVLSGDLNTYRFSFSDPINHAGGSRHLAGPVVVLCFVNVPCAVIVLSGAVAVGVGVGIAAGVAWAMAHKHPPNPDPGGMCGGDCPPCDPPPLEPPAPPRVDTTHSHGRCKGAHYHIYSWEQNQNPVTCQCFNKKVETVICL